MTSLAKSAMMGHMAKRGRPRGANINPEAVEDMLRIRAMQKGELAEAAGISPTHLADMMRRQKGANVGTVRAMATALRCSPGTLAPELTGQFIPVRPGDPRGDE